MSLCGILGFNDLSPLSVFKTALARQRLVNIGFVFCTKAQGEDETRIIYMDDQLGLQNMTLETFRQNPLLTHQEFMEYTGSFRQFHQRIIRQITTSQPPQLEHVILERLGVPGKYSETNLSFAMKVVSDLSFSDVPTFLVLENPNIFPKIDLPEWLSGLYFSLYNLGVAKLSPSASSAEYFFRRSEHFGPIQRLTHPSTDLGTVFITLRDRAENEQVAIKQLYKKVINLIYFNDEYSSFVARQIQNKAINTIEDSQILIGFGKDMSNEIRYLSKMVTIQGIDQQERAPVALDLVKGFEAYINQA